MTIQEVKNELEDLAQKIRDLDAPENELSEEAKEILDESGKVVLQALVMGKLVETLARYLDIDLEKLAKFSSLQN